MVVNIYGSPNWPNAFGAGPCVLPNIAVRNVRSQAFPGAAEYEDPGPGIAICGFTGFGFGVLKRLESSRRRSQEEFGNPAPLKKTGPCHDTMIVMRSLAG